MAKLELSENIYNIQISRSRFASTLKCHKLELSIIFSIYSVIFLIFFKNIQDEDANNSEK